MPKKNRCYKCNKKVGLTPILCKCEHIFCSKCRYPEEHDCKFNYFESNQEIIKQNVGGGEFSKMERIQ